MQSIETTCVDQVFICSPKNKSLQCARELSYHHGNHDKHKNLYHNLFMFANRGFIHRLCVSPGQKHNFTMLFDSHLTRCTYLCFSYGYCMLDPRYIWHYGKTTNSEKTIRQQLPPLDASREKSLRTLTR